MLELVELGDVRQAPARPALRRPAAARRAGAGADQPAPGAAARRAARGPRPQAAPADADRAQADPDRGRHHLHPRHPRPGGGHDHGRHHRGDEQGRHRAAWAPRPTLYDNPATTFVSNFLGQSQPRRGRGASGRGGDDVEVDVRRLPRSPCAASRAHRTEGTVLGRASGPRRSSSPGAGARSRPTATQPARAAARVSDVSYIGVSTQYLVRDAVGPGADRLRAEQRRPRPAPRR